MKVEGIFAIDKPLGISSQRAVQIVKYWARRKTGNKKIKVGHAGTLDPLASGVLVVAVGREFTSKIDSVVKAEKEYVAELLFGQTSSTDDAEGQKTVINKNKKPTKEEIKKVLKRFKGHIEQTPPVYSAIKINGQEAYKRVRKGEKVEMKKRKVYIKDIDIISYNYPKLRLNITCGKGTYVRSLARDIGDELGVGAYLSELVRTRVGDYVLLKARDIKDFTMKIAIHASELDGDRIDGTKTYISEMLNRFSKIAGDDDFLIYHKGSFNKRLKPSVAKNYIIKKLTNIPLWTQTIFAFSVWLDRSDVVWLPLHNLPRLRSKNIKYIVTIHDLAFKLFPKTFSKTDVKKLNLQTDYAVKNTDHIIAVSKATRNDLLKFYPKLKKEKITVVHHGVDSSQWQKQYSKDVVKQILSKYGVVAGEYLIHVGAVQPRKNLITIIKAFTKIRTNNQKLKLLLIGGDGWLSEKIHTYAKNSKYDKDIIFTGNVLQEDKVILMQDAKMFIFPSLYEGFGIGALEAMATGIPVVAANNSSLPEVLGDAALYFDAKNSDECAEVVMKILNDEILKEKMIATGLNRVGKFSWDDCAKKTLRVLRQ